MTYILDFAQLCMDVYAKPEHNIFRKYAFNKNWIVVHTWDIPALGFKANLYRDTVNNICVLCFRGSNNPENYKEDLDFALNLDTKIFYHADRIFFELEHNIFWQNASKHYVTGHSLGGMIAKVCVPLSKADTITFCSPGVFDFMQTNHIPIQKLPEQKVLTFISNADIIGNFRFKKDFGDHIFVPVLDGGSLDKKDDRPIDYIEFGVKGIAEGIIASSKFGDPVAFHSMKNMYNYLAGSKYKNDTF